MPSTPAKTTFGQLPPSRFPGERLGLPEKGINSVGRVGRRLLAVFIDWGIAVVVSVVFFNYHPLATLMVFVGLQIIFIPSIGGSIGHRLTGLHLISLTGGWVGLWRPVLRSVLLGLVLPALVWDSDQRGFHDKIAGTVLIRA